jgi:hypothetical protein
MYCSECTNDECRYAECCGTFHLPSCLNEEINFALPSMTVNISWIELLDK